MNIYIDCEYNSFKGELISMALVAENGEEWYEVLPCARPHPWVAAHVLPVLNREAIELEKFRASLETWLNQFKSIHIISDWPEDIAHFCSALITTPGDRIKTPHFTAEIFRIDAPSEIPHNALSDARGVRKALCGE